jgi:general stress protein YciG
MIDITKGRIAIFSGEGEVGSWSEYTGKRTERALKAKLTRERSHGDRWAYAYIETDMMDKYTGLTAYMEIHWEKDQYDNDVLREGEMRTPNLDNLDTSRAAATLGRKGGQARSEAKTAAARENGKKGGRPRKKTE